MKIVVSEAYKTNKDALLDLVNNFSTTGDIFVEGKRNTIRTFNVNSKVLNVKSFKIPNFINKVGYRFFRSSKAKRSFINASYLMKHNIGTPIPVAYVEDNKSLLFGKSFYLSEQVDFDIMYRDLVKDPTIENHEDILRHFTRFTYQLHENKVLFKDHSPGNTLIKIEKNQYHFYLVDLNRMVFKTLLLEERIKNFERLTPKKEMVAIMSDEYAKLINEPYDVIFNLMWQYTQTFQEKFYRKKRLKNNIGLK